MRAERESARDALAEVLCRAGCWQHADLAAARDQVVAGPEPEPDEDVGRLRGLDEIGEIDGLDISLPGRREEACPVFEVPGKDVLGFLVTSAVAPAPEFGDALVQLPAHEFDDRLGQHRAGEEVAGAEAASPSVRPTRAIRRRQKTIVIAKVPSTTCVCRRAM